MRLAIGPMAMLLLLGSAALAQEAAAPAPGRPDIVQAVRCATLSQQFGDTLTALTAPTAKAKLDDTVKATASEQAAAGRKACMAHDHEAGLEQLRQGIATLGKKPVV
jgi:uncharacterized protein (DUF1501 family)